MAQGSALLTGSDDFYQKVLNRNIGTLIEDLDPQPVLDTLLAEEFIPYTQVRDIQELRLTSEKNRKIIEFVITRGRDGYLNFKKCLVKSGQKHIADSLERAETVLRREAQMEQTQRASGIKITPRVPTNDDLMDIAQHIGNNWEFVGTRLKISQPKIDQIKLDNLTTDMKIYKLLLHWRDSQPNSNTIDKLLAVLRELRGLVTLDWQKIQDIANRKPEKGNINVQRESPVNGILVDSFKLITNDGNMMRDRSADFQTDEDQSLNSTAFKDQFGQTRMQDPNRTNINQPDISGSFSSFPRRVDEENFNVMDGPPARPGKHDTMDARREDIDTLQRPTTTLTEGSINFISELKISELSRIVNDRQFNPSQAAEITAPKPVSTSGVMPVEPESFEAKRNNAGNLDASAFHFSPESAKAELSMSPHDGRLRTPSVECFKFLISTAPPTPLGSGGYGIVYRPKDTAHGLGIPVVIKVIESNQEDEIVKFSITNEKIASRTIHFSIVPLLAMTEDVGSGKSYFLYPYLSHGDLGALIREDSEKIKMGRPEEITLVDRRRLLILYHVSSALEFLHTEMPGFRGGILHLDLSSKNIVLDEMWNARLIDFGLAREMDQGSKSTARTLSKMYGTPGYMQSTDRTSLTTADDYYNFGVVIRECLTGIPPAACAPNTFCMLKDMTRDIVLFNVQEEIWKSTDGSDNKVAVKLADLSEDCLKKTDDLKKMKTELIDLMGNSSKWNTHPHQEQFAKKCEMCLVNTSVTGCVDLLLHDRNCTNPIHVCVACMRNSYLNPIECHTCNEVLDPIIGCGWGAILIAGNDTKKEKQDLARGFKNDILEIKKVIVSKCPLVMGISEKSVEVIAPEEPGVPETMQNKFYSAVDNLKKKRDIHTLVIYFTGHYYPEKGFLLGGEEEFLTGQELVRNMQEIANQYSAENKPRTRYFTEKRFIVFLDCCNAPDLTDIFNKSEKNSDAEPNLVVPSNGKNLKEEKISKKNYCILQINAGRPTETTKGSREGSLFTRLFLRCLTERAIDQSGGKRNRYEKLCQEDFIRINDVQQFIEMNGGNLSPLQPVKNEKATLSADSILAYNINFIVALEFRIKDTKNTKKEMLKIPPGFHSNLQHLKNTLLQLIIDRQKKGEPNLLFEGDDSILKSFTDCICFEIERGPKKTFELTTFDELMAAWNSKREITISLRTIENIDRGKVLVYTGTTTNEIQAFLTDCKRTRKDIPNSQTFPLNELTAWLKEMRKEKRLPEVLQAKLTAIHARINHKSFEVKENTELHIMFPKTPEEGAGASECMCLEIQNLHKNDE